MTETRRTQALAMLAAVVWLVILWRHAGDDEATPPRAPARLDAEITTCGDTHAPARHARRVERRAAAQMTRYAFHPADGIAAAASLSEAVACFTAADARDDAARLRRRHAAWRARIDRDYRDARLRLAHALRQDSDARVRHEAARLHALVGRGHAPYARWLRALALDDPRPERPMP